VEDRPVWKQEARDSGTMPGFLTTDSSGTSLEGENELMGLKH
jgi:hypothetical protein